MSKKKKTYVSIASFTVNRSTIAGVDEQFSGSLPTVTSVVLDSGAKFQVGLSAHEVFKILEEFDKENGEALDGND